MDRKPSILEQIFSVCEQGGCILQVDAAFYERFLNYTDAEMDALIAKVIKASSKDINAIAQTEGKTDNEIFESIQRTLLFLAHGIMAFDASGKLAFFKPSSYPPPRETGEKILQRIARARPQLEQILWNMLLEQKNLLSGYDSSKPE